MLAHIMSTCPASREALESVAVESDWRSVGPLHPGIRRTSDGGGFFVGNAAGEAHPVIAEGISMAMQSGFLLARMLADNSDRRDARRRYAAAWHHLFASRIRAAAAIAHWAMRPMAVAISLPLLSAFPAVLTQGARSSGKVSPICSAAPEPIRVFSRKSS